MAGSLLLGGASYSLREYLQVAAIIGGTAIVSMGKKKGGGSTSSTMGVVYIILSLVLDGVTAGFQKRLKRDTAAAGVKPKPYDFMFYVSDQLKGNLINCRYGQSSLTSTPWLIPIIFRPIFSCV